MDLHPSGRDISSKVLLPLPNQRNIQLVANTKEETQ